MDRHDAELLLEDQPVGAFLFRFSENRAQPICSFRCDVE
jgi:hypothetical protein